MSGIFVSYRRDDTLSATGRLADALAEGFGTSEVFRDLGAIVAGEDFRESLADGLRSASIVVVVIGPSWLRPYPPTNQPRLFAAEDYVRFEIETALSSDLPIIPVLVEGARMPKAEDLPESIRDLSFRQAHEISETRWQYDVDGLIDAISRNADLIPIRRSSRLQTVSDPPLHQVLRDALLSIPSDFLKLFYMPRRFLAMRGTDAHGNLLRAFVFLIVLQVVAAGIVLLEWPTELGKLQFILTAPLFILLGALAVSAPLYLAWRLAGGHQYRRILIILLYQSAVLGLTESLIAVITMVGVKIELPGVIEDLARNMTLDGLKRFATALESAPTGVSLVIASQVNTLIALGCLIWLAVTWGAYRDALQQSRGRSLTALALFAMFCGTPLAFFVWVASLFQV